MDKDSEKADAAAIEQAVPGSDVSVEELTLPDGEKAEVAVIVTEAPKNEMDAGYAIGHLESRLARLEEHIAAQMAQMAAFETATVAAVEAEAAAIEEQGEVLSDVAEEVLPEDHEAAQAHNPDHGSRKCSWWEQAMGGSPHPRRGGG